ncbi:hypothetical protein WJX81_002112 [Elliptochloris bilobata]|uniref:Cupin 2 conserved barrel domain-containing protein n=1 Tax=Elliptochloris bilobata TaxID=381761 RepID=A0AAW1SCW0_9CHLO
MQEALLLNTLSELEHGRFRDKFGWFSFVQGKVSAKRTVASRAYINLRELADVPLLAAALDGRAFVTERGAQHRCSVEYAPCQRVPPSRVKRDPREGTIEADPEYLAFVEELKKEPAALPSAEAQAARRAAEASAGGGEPAPAITPLMAFLLDQQSAKGDRGRGGQARVKGEAAAVRRGAAASDDAEDAGAAERKREREARPDKVRAGFQAQVELTAAGQERLHAGDSLLLPPGQAAALAQSVFRPIRGADSGSPADGYWAGEAPQLATLTLLVPDTESEGSKGPAVAQAAAAWAAAPAVGQLSAHAVREALARTQGDVLRYVLPSIAARLDAAGRGSAGGGGGAAVALKRSLLDLVAFRLPGQTNRLALIYDPLSDQVPFTFGVEIFEAGHRTMPHSHASAHELFFILAGEGEGFCDGSRFPLKAGDVVVFPPRSTHGIDVAPSGRLYALELMQPNDMFAELVKSGRPTGGLRAEDLCVLASLGCG